MRAVIQRIKNVQVYVEKIISGAIGTGLLVYLCAAPGDTEDDVRYMAEKISTMRIFPDSAGKMNRSVVDSGGSVMVVSQFTLLADARAGRRPSFSGAAEPDTARQLYESFVNHIRERGLSCETGVFGANMEVHSINDGPVTILLDSRKPL
ncbi:D-aminoacyl-tRNA deacylase [Spirochaetia bacterium]|nr:D-aminoacyl-tRNA deacylase [Spirochaetia bacterium]GHU34555.1 D-aminoacyl-tRNA deacylase [Spirochaetia bacterium]